MKIGDQIIQDQSVQLPRAVTGSFSRDMTAATGTQAVTGLGFQPSCILIFGMRLVTDIMFSIGFSGYAADQITANDLCMTRMFNDTMEASGVSIYNYQTTPGLNRYLGNVDTYDTDGFTVGWQKVGATTGILSCYFIAFK